MGGSEKGFKNLKKSLIMNSRKKSNQQNVDNMELLTKKVATFEPEYDPSEERLSIPNQIRIKASGDEVLLGVRAAESACNNATSARSDAFNTLDPLVTRTINALRISDVSEQTILQGESIVREIRNMRATVLTPSSKIPNGAQNGESKKINKLHGGSFNTRIENFRRLIILLSTIPAYKPKQVDLTIDSLNMKLETLNLVNTTYITAEAKADAARVQRDSVLYAAKTGLVDIAMDSKLYVKSAYGATSPQFKSVSSILFTRRA